MNIKTKTICLILVACGLFAFIAQDDPSRKIIDAIDKVAAENPQEKVFIHTDKPYYSAGDTIWYKTYVVEAEQNRPTSISAVVNVDFVNDRDSVVTSQKLKLSSGLGNAQITLPITLPAGDYTLYGYTNWMRNNDQSYFFTKKIAVVNPFKETAGKQDRDTKLSLSFFPEGGDLVNGIRSIVAFKAVAADGLGQEIAGHIEDQSGTKVIDFKTDHLGMGLLALVPEEGKSYLAVLSNGYKQGLPVAKSAGFTLSASNQTDGKLGIKVASSNVQPEDLIVVIQQNGRIKFMSKVKPDPVANFSVPEQKFQTGIAQITLFKGEVPVAERLMFIDRGNFLTMQVKSDKSTYEKREKANIELDVFTQAGEPVLGSFSVSVIDAAKVVYNEDMENTILSNLLITSDLRGHIENPGYYFNARNANRKRHLDLLMLTQGWRRFSWTEILSGKDFPQAFKPEVSLAVSGRILSGKNPIANAKAALLFYKDRLYTIDTVTNDKGEFNFDKMGFPDSLLFVLQANTPKGGTSVKTFFNEPVPVKYLSNSTKSPFWSDISAYMETSKLKYQQVFSKYENNRISIQAVEIREKRFPVIPYSANMNGPGRADYVVTAKDLENRHSLITYLGTFGRGLYLKGNELFSKRQLPGGGPVRIFLDGIEIGSDLADMIPVDDIAGVEVMLAPSFAAMYGGGVTDGVIELTTKRGPNGRREVNTPGLRTFKPKGFVAERVFYSPKYVEPTFSAIKDLRSTLFWEPNLITNKLGKATVSFYNADSGRVKIIVQGIDADGRLGYQVHEYAVK